MMYICIYRPNTQEATLSLFWYPSRNHHSWVQRLDLVVCLAVTEEATSH